MDQSTLEQVDDILDDQSPMVTPESPGDISTSSPKSTNSDSILFCLTCGIFEEDMEAQSMILDDESSAYCSQKCWDEFQKEVQARIMMECTQKEQKQQKDVQPATTPTQTRTGGKPRQSQATNAQSVRTVSRDKAIYELRRTYSSTEHSEQPYDLQKELSSITTTLKKQYNVKPDQKTKVDTFLQFILLTTEICPKDNIKKIQSWGKVKQSTFAEHLGHFASQRNLNYPSWGKTVNVLLTSLAQQIWPKSAQNIIGKIKKNRSWYGLRFKTFNGYNDSFSTPTSDRDRHSDSDSPQSLSSTPVSTSGSSESSYSPATPFSTHLTRTRHSKMQFQPYYDILENGDCYVVRIFTPAMAPQDANKLQITSNLAQKYVSVTGAYIPGCVIGDQLTDQFGIHKPLTSSICSQPKKSGYMDLKIALPTDIKDDERSIQFAHVMWGLAIHFPRRKQVQDVSMRFTSCFGTCNLDVEHTNSLTNKKATTDDVQKAAEPRQTSSMDITEQKATVDGVQKAVEPRTIPQTESPVDPQGTNTKATGKRTPRSRKRKATGKQTTRSPKRNSTRKRTTRSAKRKTTVKHKTQSTSPKATTSKATSKRTTPPVRERLNSKQDLIGRTFSLRGELWGEAFAGNLYDMTVIRLVKTIKTGDTKKYDTFILREDDDQDDNEYEFYLGDLKDFGLLTEEEYAALATDADPY